MEKGLHGRGPSLAPSTRFDMDVCKTKGCSNKVLVLSMRMCNGCYLRERRRRIKAGRHTPATYRKRDMTDAEFKDWFRSQLRKVESPSHVEGKCHVWPKALNGDYGQISANGIKAAHRVAWFLEHGYYPKPPYQVNHHCDVPVCCNPDHLYEGTQEDNMQDRADRGRNRL